MKIYRTREYILLAVFTVLVVWVISLYYYQVLLISGDSMEPTLHNLQMVLVDKRSNEYSSGDVIVFWCEGLNETLVKRVIAEPRDTVQIRDGVLYVNDQVNEVYGETRFIYSGILAVPATLSDGEYMVIGDNIMYSIDSRYESVGLVKLECIIGKVIY